MVRIHLSIFLGKFINAVINEIIQFRFGQYRKNARENSNILHLKTLKTFNRFDINFKIYYNNKKTKTYNFIYIISF